MLPAAAFALAVVGAAAAGERPREQVPRVSAVAAKAPYDRAFIDAMVPHHRSAIAMARLAQRRGLDKPVLVRIARDIVKSQQEEIDRMLAWRKRWYGSAKIDARGGMELGLSARQMGMNHDLSELRRAEDVDRAFARMMIPHHQGAMRMAKLALERARHPELRVLAREIIRAQQREIRQLRPFANGEHGH